MRVYLTSRYDRKQELRQLAEQLRAEAIEVVSAWHDIDSPSSDGFAGMDEQRLAWLAMLELQQLVQTSVLVLFLDAGRCKRGDPHLETGVALALGKRLLLIGKPEMKFHCLPDVERFPAWPECLARLLELRSHDSMNTRVAAAVAGVTRGELVKWIRSGKLAAAKLGPRYVIARKDLDQVLAREARRKADAIADVRASRLFRYPEDCLA